MKWAKQSRIARNKMIQNLFKNRFRRRTTISRFSAIPRSNCIGIKIDVYPWYTESAFYASCYKNCSMRKRKMSMWKRLHFTQSANESMTIKNTEKVAKTNQKVLIGYLKRKTDQKHGEKRTIICSFDISQPMILMRCNLIRIILNLNLLVSCRYCCCFFFSVVCKFLPPPRLDSIFQPTMPYFH